jgi:ankyrin repeat protein
MKKLLIVLMFALALHANIMQDIENFNINLEKANKGDNEAKYVTALNYFQAKGTQKNTKEGMYWLLTAVKDGYAKAIWLTIKIYFTSENKKDHQRAKKLLLLLADYESYFPKKYAKDSKNINSYKAMALVRLAELSQIDEEKTAYYLKAFALNESSVLSRNTMKKAVDYLDTRVKALQTEITLEKNAKLFRYAIERGDLTLLQNNIDKVKDINKFYVINKYLPQTARYRVDMTPLLMAIQNDNISLAEDLIKHGADINLANSRGETPILCAMRNRHVALAKELMKLGADTSKLDNEKNSVFSYAIILGEEDLALQVLQNKNFNIHEWINGGTFSGKFDAYAEYISKEKSKDGMFTYLHLAAKNDALLVIQRLVEMGLDVNATMRSRHISLDALGIAARYASLESVKLLIKLGATPYVVYTNENPEGNYGLSYWGGLSSKYTPLSMALCREDRDKTIAEYLLSLKNARWYVEHESEYFYFYLLQMKEVDVLKFFDENRFKDKEKIREKFELVMKKKK